MGMAGTRMEESCADKVGLSAYDTCSPLERVLKTVKELPFFIA